MKHSRLKLCPQRSLCAPSPSKVRHTALHGGVPLSRHAPQTMYYVPPFAIRITENERCCIDDPRALAVFPRARPPTLDTKSFRTQGSI